MTERGPRAPASLAATAPAEHQERLLEWLQATVARVTGAAAPAAAALALDSLAAVELGHAIASELGVELPLAEILDAPSLPALAARLGARLDASGPAGAAPGPAPLRRAPGAEVGEHPPSYGQRGLWFLEQLAPGSGAYTIAVAARLDGAADHDALGRAFAALVERHPALRTTFAARGGEPVQQVRAALAPDWRVEDAAGWSDAELHERLAGAAWRPFDLAAGPLLRVRLFAGAPGGDALLLAVHHAVADLWSLAVLLGELRTLYRGEIAAASAPAGLTPGSPPPPPPTPPAPAEPPLRPSDFARWQRAALAGPEGERLWDFWRQRLAGELPVLDLPVDRPRPPRQTFRGASGALRLPPAAAARLRSAARAREATLAMLLLTAFQALLERHSGQQELVLGVPAAGREDAALAGVVGYFVNPVVVRADLRGDPAWSELVGRTRRELTAALAHQGFPVALAGERLAPERDPARPPLFQAMFVLERAPVGAPEVAAFALGAPGARLDLGGFALAPLRLAEERVQVELALLAAEEGGAGGLAALLQWNADLFDAVSGERLLRHLETLLLALAPELDARLSELPLVPEAERRQLVLAGGGEDAAGPADACLHRRFEAQAADTPEATALLAGEAWLSYGELNRRANRLAHRLRAAGIGPEMRVGICLGRTAEMVAAILAVLKAGAAYVPLDPAYPAARLAGLCDDAGIALLLTRAGDGAALAAAAAPRLLLDSWEGCAGWSAADPTPAAAPASLAYVIYTSGSTGRPKGCAIAHRGAAALVRWARQVYSPAELSGVLAATSICFDLSIFELFVPLSWGGRAVLAANLLALPELPGRDAVTLVNTVPSALAELLRLGGLPAGVRTVNLAGEPLPAALVAELYRQPGVTRVYNLYGPSEDTTYSTFALAADGGGDGAGGEAADGRAPAIGLPLAGRRACLLDRRLRAVPAGAVGEIHLGGCGLARGYLGRPELTAERFLPDAVSGLPGERLYATGDLARLTPAGELDILGRGDHQVKVRGFRIELGEIEAALLRHPRVAAAAVEVCPGAAGDRRLVAFLTPAAAGAAVVRGDGDAAAGAGGGGALATGAPAVGATAAGASAVGATAAGAPAAGAPAPEELRRHLRRSLPEFMLPALFVALPALPRTPSGKIDRRALRALGTGAAAAGAESGAAPRGALEEALLDLWRELLGRREIGRDESFFHLGGHSLLAARLAARIEERLGVAVPLAVLFAAPTIASLAAHLGAAAGSAPAAPPRPAPRGGPLPLSYGQQQLWLVERLQPGTALYNMPLALALAGELDRAALAAAVGELRRRHHVLRTVLREGPGGPVQVVTEAIAAALPAIDLAALGAAARAAAAAGLAAAEARRPFDLGRGPLLRATLLRLGARDHHLLLTVHHCAADFASLGILVTELAALYGAAAARRPSPLPEPPLQYADYAVWQRRWLSGEALAGKLDGYARALAGLPALGLVLDRPRPPAAARTPRGTTVVAVLAGDEVAAARQLARQRGATLFMLLLAACETLLFRYRGERRFAVATAVANRERAGLGGLVGFFANTLALPAEVAPEAGFGALLGAVRTAAVAAYARQDVPFELLVQRLAPARGGASNELCEVMVVHLERPPAPHLPGLALRRLPVGAGVAKLDLTLTTMEGSGGALEAVLEVAADLASPPAVARLLGHFRVLLAAASAAPEARLGELPLLAAAERHQLLVEWRDHAAAAAADGGGRAGAGPGGTARFLLDRFLNPLPLGVPGELLTAAAAARADGLREPTAVPDSFGADGLREPTTVPDPFGADGLRGPTAVPDPFGADGGLLRRTGSWARFLPDGRAEVLGRAADAAPPARGAADAPAAPGVREGEGRAPRSHAEAVIATAWAELLGLPSLAIDDNVLVLGAHSLLATRLVARLRAELGVELPLRRIFEHPTVAELAQAVAAARRDGTAAPGAAAIVPLARDGGDLPLSFAQERLWFLALLDPGSPAYNLPAAFLLRGRLVPAALEGAFAALLARHEALRTRFPTAAGRPAAVVDAAPAWGMATVDLAALPVAARAGAARRLATEEARRPFALAQGPLLRATLLRLGEEEHLLLVSLHHIVADGWSLTVLTREVAAGYGAALAAAGRGAVLSAAGNGAAPGAAGDGAMLSAAGNGAAPGAAAAALPPLPIQYADFAAWQRDALAGERLARLLDYWRRQLAGLPTALALTVDRPRQALAAARGAVRTLALEAPLVGRLAAVGSARGATLFTVLLAAWQTLLWRWSGEADFAVGTPVAGRDRRETEDLIGLLVNTLVLRRPAAAAPGLPFAAAVAAVGDAALDAFAHQDLPFERLVAELAPERALGRSPLFQVLFVLQNLPPAPLALPGLEIVPLPGERPAAKLDLTLEAQPERGGGLLLLAEHDPGLWDGSSMTRMLLAYASLLRAAAGDPGLPLGGLPLLAPAEIHQLAREWNDTRTVLAGAAACLHELIADQAARAPDAVAVECEAEQLSYGALDERAGRLAARLRELGVGPEVPVGIFAERAAATVVALLAVLKAGGAYLPLDPSHPRERLERMAADAGLAVVIAQPGVGGGAPPPAAQVVWLGGDPAAGAAPWSAAGPDNLAYVLYTSGSTGRPKAAMNSHRGIVNRLLAMQDTYRLTAADKVLQKTPFSFDVSVWELFWPLLAGARLVMARPDGHRDPAYLLATIVGRGVTTLHFVPAMLKVFLDAAGIERAASLSRVIVSGEALAGELVARFRALLPAVPLHNLYGPTEAAIDVTSWACTAAAPDRRLVPIGRPAPNCRIHLLDPWMRPVPAGFPGELYIGGVQLCRGYLGRPELTAERFVPDPVGGEAGERLYRTGDSARLCGDGAVEFLGRLDQQVKIRGFRIELEEIEAVLGGHPGVREAAVLVREDRPGERRLVAVVVPAGAAPPPAGELADFLARALPFYMVPQAFVTVAALPHLPSGKLDRKSLHDNAPVPRAGSGGGAGAAPRSAVEEVLAGLWAELLDAEEVGIDDSFFTLGGHSLLAVEMLAWVESYFKAAVPLRQLFETPTVAALAAAVVAAGASPREVEETAALLLEVSRLSAAEAESRLAASPDAAGGAAAAAAHGGGRQGEGVHG